MHCVKCKSENTRVVDVAHSHKDYGPANGHYYLQAWAKRTLQEIGTTDAYTVRIIKCSDCDHRFRTFELPHVAAPRDNSTPRDTARDNARDKVCT